MSPRDSSVPRDKCFLSNHRRASETLPVLNSNNLHIGGEKKIQHPSNVAWNFAYLPVLSHASAVSTTPSSGPMTNPRTFVTDPGGLAESSAVAVESRGTRPTRGQILGSCEAAPGSWWAGELLGEHGAPWTDVGRRTHAPGGYSHLWEWIGGSESGRSLTRSLARRTFSRSFQVRFVGSLSCWLSFLFPRTSGNLSKVTK